MPEYCKVEKSNHKACLKAASPFRPPPGRSAGQAYRTRGGASRLLPQSPLKKALQCVAKRTVQGFCRRLHGCKDLRPGSAGVPPACGPKGPRSQGPPAADRAILYTG